MRPVRSPDNQPALSSVRRIECAAAREVDLHGLTLDEAEAKVREQIDDYQAHVLENMEIELIDAGADPDESAATVAGYRTQLAEVREQLIEKMRAMVGRGGKGLQ